MEQWIEECHDAIVGQSVTFSQISEDPLYLVFRSSVKCEVGTAYHHRESPYVRVLSVLDDGVLVGYVSGAGDAFSNVLTEYVEKLKLFIAKLGALMGFYRLNQGKMSEELLTEYLSKR